MTLSALIQYHRGWGMGRRIRHEKGVEFPSIPFCPKKDAMEI